MRASRQFLWTLLLLAGLVALALTLRSDRRERSRIEHSTDPASADRIDAALSTPRNDAGAASPFGSRSARAAVEAETASQEVTRPATAALVALVAFEDPRMWESIDVGLLASESRGAANAMHWISGTKFKPTSDGGFQKVWDDLVPGTYDVLLLVRGALDDARPQHAVAELDVETVVLGASETRRVEVDARGHLRVLDVVVADSNGIRLPDAMVWSASGTWFVDARGEATIVQPHGPVDVTVDAPEHLGERRRVDVDVARCEFRLHRASAVHVLVEQPLLEDGERIDWYCLSDRSNVESDQLSDGCLHRREPWYPTRAGKLEFQAQLARHASVRIRQPSHIALEVTAGMAEQELVLRVLASEVDEARVRLDAFERRNGLK